jgi:hypothetical protein
MDNRSSRTQAEKRDAERATRAEQRVEHVIDQLVENVDGRNRRFRVPGSTRYAPRRYGRTVTLAVYTRNGPSRVSVQTG